jgi:hypothetical protein
MRALANYEVDVKFWYRSTKKFFFVSLFAVVFLGSWVWGGYALKGEVPFVASYALAIWLFCLLLSLWDLKKEERKGGGGYDERTGGSV